MSGVVQLRARIALVCLGLLGVSPAPAQEPPPPPGFSGDPTPVRSEVNVPKGKAPSVPDTVPDAKPRQPVRTGRAEGRDARRREGFYPRPIDESPGSLLGGALALGPGFLVHGLGHLYIGETRTAWQLFLTEVVGVGLAVTGLLLDAPSQKSGGVGGLRQGLLHTGTVLFLSSWLADVLGAFKGAAALDQDTSRTEGSRLGLAYRYTDDPVAPFRHHIVLRLDLDTGWFFARPKIDLEASLALRQMQLELGTRVFRGRNAQNRVIVGARLRRLENSSFGYTAMGVMGYVDAKSDLGQVLPNLRNFYLFGRIGYGYDGLSFAESTDSVPNVFAEAEFYDTYLVIESGMGFNLSRLTHIEAAFVQDPTRDIRPFAGREGGLFELSLTYRQSDSLDIEFVGTAGDALAVWLGLGFGL